eukprot:768695-Hanusia_phi.AAC.3
MAVRQGRSGNARESREVMLGDRGDTERRGERKRDSERKKKKKGESRRVKKREERGRTTGQVERKGEQSLESERKSVLEAGEAELVEKANAWRPIG